jgi:hypothetical protein
MLVPFFLDIIKEGFSMSTIKDIQIRSKGGAAKFTCDRPWAAIQVVTKEGDWPKLSEANRVGSLQLNFADVVFNKEDFSDVSENYVLFSDQDANRIIDFMVDVWDKIDVLLVHCEMGISRSPAIGAAIAHGWHGAGCENVFFQNYTPNMFVYSNLLKKICERTGQPVPMVFPRSEDNILEDPWNPLDNSDGGTEVPMKKLSEITANEHFYYEYGKPPAISCHEFVKLAKVVSCVGEDGKTVHKFNCWNVNIEDLFYIPDDAEVQQV